MVAGWFANDSLFEPAHNGCQLRSSSDAVGNQHHTASFFLVEERSDGLLSGREREDAAKCRVPGFVCQGTNRNRTASTGRWRRKRRYRIATGFGKRQSGSLSAESRCQSGSNQLAIRSRCFLWYSNFAEGSRCCRRQQRGIACRWNQRPASLRLPRYDAGCRPSFLLDGRDQDIYRHDGFTQYQPLPLAFIGRPGLAYRDQEVSEVNRNRFDA